MRLTFSNTYDKLVVGYIAQVKLFQALDTSKILHGSLCRWWIHFMLGLINQKCFLLQRFVGHLGYGNTVTVFLFPLYICLVYKTMLYKKIRILNVKQTVLHDNVYLSITSVPAFCCIAFYYNGHIRNR